MQISFPVSGYSRGNKIFIMGMSVTKDYAPDITKLVERSCGEHDQMK